MLLAISSQSKSFSDVRINPEHVVHSSACFIAETYMEKTRYGLYAPSRGGLDMLDLRHGTVVRTLIPKIAEGIFNVMCKFNEGSQTVF